RKEPTTSTTTPGRGGADKPLNGDRTSPQREADSADIEIVLYAMNEWGSGIRFDRQGVATLIAECRQRNPHAKAGEIAEEIRIKAPIVAKKRDVDNPFGYLKAAVVKMFDGRPPDRREPSRSASCPKCGTSLEGRTVLNGLCSDCYVPAAAAS